MSTNTVHTDPSTHGSFYAIDQHVKNVDLEGSGEQSPLPQSRIERLTHVYTGARPILAALSAVTLIPLRWRETLRVFISLIDEITVAEPSTAKESL
jgi:hypothetical protein